MDEREMLRLGEPLRKQHMKDHAALLDFKTKVGADKVMDEQKAQELVRQAMEREKWVAPPKGVKYLRGDKECMGLEGVFTADELEAMAWCMRNDKWPRRA